jgi:hypothetical protein
MRSTHISLDQYYEICSETNISPNYHPSFVEFYFAQLGKKPKIIGRFNNQGQLIAAYPVLYGQIFPNTLHKRLLGKDSIKLGDIGQPEALFPIAELAPKISLNCFSPTTSPILSGLVRKLPHYSLKNIAIARNLEHRRLSREKRSLKKFLKEGGKIYFTDELERREFADIYIRLHCDRWGYSVEDFRYIREQIIELYKHIFGSILVMDNEPVAVLLCYKVEGKTIYYIDAINMGAKIAENKQLSYGSTMILMCLRKAEDISHSIRKELRFSFGYYYGTKNYKHLWTRPEKTFIGL